MPPWILLCGLFVLATGCAGDGASEPGDGKVIVPPAQCEPGRPDCSTSVDQPESEDLTPSNSAGLRFSEESGGLVLDRVASLPDADGDGVPDDADDCPGTPDWITCDDDPTNDGVYATLFYDPNGTAEVSRNVVARTEADIPQIDVYFLIDATPTLAEEITVLQDEILTIIGDVRLVYEDARFGLGIYREYPLEGLADAFSQSPYHHILDLTDDDALIQTAMSTLDTVANDSPPSAATQALYSVASGLGLGSFVPNRAGCPDGADVGYPCFRPDALHVVMNVTDAPVHNGPRLSGPEYGDPPFGPGVGDGVTSLPPVRMFPSLFGADDTGSALVLGDLSSLSLTVMGMSTLLTDQVNTAVAPGCAPPPPVPPDPPIAPDGDAKDAVLELRFDASVLSVDVFANNTHWPGANLALFSDPELTPAAAEACDGGTGGDDRWGAILGWTPVTSRTYYLVADGIVPADEPTATPEGAFSISIVHDGDPANPSWLTTDAPVVWDDVRAALLASDVRVASVVTPPDAMTSPVAGELDARLIALNTDALTRSGTAWVTELASPDGEGLDAAISNTLVLPKTESAYDISMRDLDDESSPVDEREFVSNIRASDCAEGEALECAWASTSRCRRCDIGAALAFDVSLVNDTVPPTAASQVFDFELLVRGDEAFEVERIPVRVLVPNQASHVFDETANAAFYRNEYDSTTRCITPPERPRWGALVWQGDVPSGTSIEFLIRTAPTLADLETAMPASVIIPTDTTSDTLDVTEELIADGLPYGLPYLSITAVLTPSNAPPATPVLELWTFDFVCEAAE